MSKEDTSPSLLFPSAVAVSSTSSSLFPVAASTEPDAKPASNLNWLQNKSFKPSDEPKQVPKEETTRDDDKHRSKRKKHKEHRDRDRDKRRRSRTPEPKKEEIKPSIYATLAKKTFLEETGLAPEHAFRKDYKCDRNNLAFSTLYRLQTARYRESDCIAVYRQSRKKRSLKPERFFSKKSIERLKSIKHPLDLSTASKDRPEDGLDLIPLASGEIPDSKETDSSTSTIQFASMQDGQSSKLPLKPTPEQIIYNKTQSFNEHLSKHPHDIEKWLEFVEFQDHIEAESGQDEKAVIAVIVDKKLSILDKAISQNPKCAALLIKRLHLARSVWTGEKISNEWKQLAFLYPNNTDIWLNYLQFAKGHLTYFTTGKVLKIYQRCFSTLSKILDGHFQTHRADDKIEDNMIVIFVDYVKFLLHIGHTERAIASFQALIEFNLSTPKILRRDLPLSEWLTFFEPFWDSGVPRFGDHNSIGWNRVMEKKEFQTSQNEPLEHEYDSMETAILSRENSQSSLASTWYDIEELREQFHWLPVKGEAAASVEDLERNVLLEDISFSFFRVNSEESKFRIVCEFLNLFSSETSCLNTFNQTSSHFINQNEFIDGLFENAIAILPNHKSYFYGRWINFKMKSLEHNREKVQVKLVRKFIKDVLKSSENRNNLDVWSDYAKFEQEFGDKRAVRKLYETAIEMTASNADKNSFLAFVISYVEHLLGLKPISQMELRLTENCDKSTDTAAATALALALLGEKVSTVTAPQQLKMKRIVEAWAPAWKFLAQKAFFLLIYLAQGLQMTSKFIEEALVLPENEERLFELHLLIQLIDVQRNVKSLRQLKFILMRALDLYPTNEQFLTLLVNIDSNLVVTGQAFRFFSKPPSKARSSLNWWTAALQLELNRIRTLREKSINPLTGEKFDLDTGLVWKARALFERALAVFEVASSLDLWLAYLKFENEFGEKKRCKSIFYRAIQACPWSKALYKIGIRLFPETLQEVLDLMTEKELRMRTVLDELNILMAAGKVKEASEPEAKD